MMKAMSGQFFEIFTSISFPLNLATLPPFLLPLSSYPGSKCFPGSLPPSMVVNIINGKGNIIS